jgi:hypothetical protein
MLSINRDYTVMVIKKVNLLDCEKYIKSIGQGIESRSLLIKRTEAKAKALADMNFFNMKPFYPLLKRW